MLKRKIENDLLHWKNNFSNQALLITGARQVGKTTTIRQFAKENYKNVAEINFLENPSATAIASDYKNTETLFKRLSAFTNNTLIPNETLIFLDEIQEAKEVVTASKYLVQKYPEYDFVFSGSMLGVELNNITSWPVGYMTVLTMYPLDFEEFCWSQGINVQAIKDLEKNYINLKPVDDFIHNLINTTMYNYFICGGMPAAVTTFNKTNNIKAVRKTQQDISNLYRNDITKYSDKRKLTIKRIFDLMPSEISSQNKKFKVKDINGNSHMDRYINDFLWLTEANVALPTYNVKEPTYPLLTSLELKNFKLFLCDIGLLTCASDMDVVRKLSTERGDINFGAFFENFVAEEFTAHDKKLLYYKNKKYGEVDFMTQQNERVVPIEVKSGKHYKRHSALTNLLSNEDFGIEKAIVLHEGNIEIEDKVVYLPCYMAMFI